MPGFRQADWEFSIAIYGTLRSLADTAGVQLLLALRRRIELVQKFKTALNVT